MFRFFFLFLPLLIDAQTIKIVSWNVENLFDMQDDGTEYAEYLPGHHGWSEAMLRKKLRNITEVICDLEADVIGLQEVENDRILKQLQASLKRAGCAYRYRAITSDRRTPIHNALLSRIPLKRARDVRITRYGRQRSILEATLDTDPPLRLFVNHWRSKRGPESERIVYARALKKRLERLPSGTEYLLLGDFNSNYNESLSIDPKHNDTHNVTGINDIMKTMRDGRMVRLDALRPGEHYSLWMELGASERWSHNFFGDKEGIDAMLIPPQLHDGKRWEYVEGSFRAFKPSYLFGRKGQVNRWAYKHGKHLGRGYSDHVPIVAKFASDGDHGSRSSPEPTWWHKAWAWLGMQPERRTHTRAEKQWVRPEKSSGTVVSGTIAQLKKSALLKQPVLLRDIHVVFRRRDSAVIQQDPDGEAILIYRAAMQLEEGRRYDLTAYKKKRYKGLDELTDVEVARRGAAFDPETFAARFTPDMVQDRRFVGRIVREIVGTYGKHSIRVKGMSIPIHFQKRAGRPRLGERLEIDRAMIGYYKDHVELQVWDKGDWQ